MSRIHYIGLEGRAVCRLPGADRMTTNRRSVTCRRCRAWLRLVFPRPRNLPLVKRKLHFYDLNTEVPGARCGMPNHMGLITGKMRNVTCGRCKRLLGLRPWRPKLIRPNCELVSIYINRTGDTILQRIDRNEMRRTQPMSEYI